ncbi:hypothetical protein SteCoe_27830 [Stentor coeruleus]|uniref:Uncharacterized protein n=1 Tax=Stentor coeruleus TaxID=5963 RepID=A0A1R2B9P7_9CILI|nr:hypothetical protein SteCoe_27830 [Stentor coeruleus]
MSSEFYDEDQAVKELKAKLKNIRDSITPLIKNGAVEPAAVPKNIREEIVQIFDEHGGIDLLSNLTKLAYSTINNWHRRWLYNPYIYRTPFEYKQRRSNALIRKVLDPEEKPEKLTKSQQVILPESSIAARIKQKITAEQESMVKKIKVLMESKIKQGLELDGEVEEQVKALYTQIQDSREVAILLGIDKNVIDEWVFDMDYE